MAQCGRSQCEEAAPASELWPDYSSERDRIVTHVSWSCGRLKTGDGRGAGRSRGGFPLSPPTFSPKNLPPSRLRPEREIREVLVSQFVSVGWQRQSVSTGTTHSGRSCIPEGSSLVLRAGRGTSCHSQLSSRAQIEGWLGRQPSPRGGRS